MKIKPSHILAARAAGCLVFIDPRRIAAARAGKPDSVRVGIPWTALIALLDELERQYPGALASVQKQLSNDQPKEKP